LTIRPRGAWPLLATAVVALAAGCGGDGDVDNDPPALETERVSVPGRGGPHGPGVTETEIRLGMTNDLAGSAETPYAVITSAIQAYFAKNSAENGGVCDREVILLAEDDAYSPERALERTRKLVEQDQVLAMIGGLGTPVHQPVAAYLNDPNGDGNKDDGVPDLFVSSGWWGWGITESLPWTIGYIPDYLTDGRVLARYFNDNLGGKKVAILHHDDDFGRDYVTGFSSTIADKALIVWQQVADASPEGGKSQVIQMRDAGAEVVLLALTPEATAAVYRTADAEGYAPKWLVSYVNSPSALAREIGGGILAEQLVKGFEELNGTVLTSYLLSAIDDAETPPLLEHRRIMETYGGPVVSTLSVYGQSLAEAVLETLARSCETIDRIGVLKAAETLQGFRSSMMLEGVEVNLGLEDHRAIQSLRVVEIQADGTLKALGDPIKTE
jgi:ABC-type branched-subunit amino acid transport system substrate-binding protein